MVPNDLRAEASISLGPDSCSAPRWLCQHRDAIGQRTENPTVVPNARGSSQLRRMLGILWWTDRSVGKLSCAVVLNVVRSVGRTGLLAVRLDSGKGQFVVALGRNWEVRYVRNYENLRV